jgi:hypothetical protein
MISGCATPSNIPIPIKEKDLILKAQLESK